MDNGFFSFGGGAPALLDGRCAMGGLHLFEKAQRRGGALQGSSRGLPMRRTVSCCPAACKASGGSTKKGEEDAEEKVAAAAAGGGGGGERGGGERGGGGRAKLGGQTWPSLVAAGHLCNSLF